MTTFAPQRLARFGGLLYLVIILTGIVGELLVRGSMVVGGDVAATAARITANPQLWRIGIGVDLLMHVCDVFVMWVIYVLLRPVNRNLALLVLLFNLIQTAVLVANKIILLVPLFLLGDPIYATAFSPAQLQAWSHLAIDLHEHGFGVGLIFFWLRLPDRGLPDPPVALPSPADRRRHADRWRVLPDQQRCAAAGSPYPKPTVSGHPSAFAGRRDELCQPAACKRRERTRVGASGADGCQRR